jgi:hypothetical protein
MILSEACLCSSILLETSLLRTGPLGALFLRLDPFGGISFAVRSVGGDVFCGSIRLGRCLLRYDHLEAFLFGGIVCAV